MGDAAQYLVFRTTFGSKYRLWISCEIKTVCSKVGRFLRSRVIFAADIRVKAAFITHYKLEA
jgi:hypothetical protein